LLRAAWRRIARASDVRFWPKADIVSHEKRLAALTVRHAVPAASEHGEFAAAGGLLSYGSDITDAYRLTGIYIGRILRGDKPAELPVQRATKVELYIKPQDRQGARPERASGTAGACGRDDQIDGHVRYWPKADIYSCTTHVRFRG
jgi:hypothetical protein